MRDARPPSQETVRTRPARTGAPKLSKSLGPHLARLAEATGAMDPRLAQNWADIAGPELAPLCRPVRIIHRGRVQALEVSVKSGAAATKLRYNQEALLGRIRQRLGLPKLSQIVFREGKEAGRWTSRRMAPAPAKPAPAKPASERPAPKSEGLKSALEAMRRTLQKDKD